MKKTQIFALAHKYWYQDKNIGIIKPTSLYFCINNIHIYVHYRHDACIPIHYEPLSHNAKMPIHTKHYLGKSTQTYGTPLITK